jgi:SHS2 domain-containing protein
MTMSAAPVPSFECIARDGDVELRLRGATVAQVLDQAARGLSDLLLRRDQSAPADLAHEVEIEAPDRASLLVNWLNELIYLSEREHWAPVQVRFHEVSDTRVSATVIGPRLAEAPARVKAATWHDLRFEVRHGAFEAAVLLDT